MTEVHEIERLQRGSSCQKRLRTEGTPPLTEANTQQEDDVLGKERCGRARRPGVLAGAGSQGGDWAHSGHKDRHMLPPLSAFRADCQAQMAQRGEGYRISDFASGPKNAVIDTIT